MPSFATPADLASLLQQDVDTATAQLVLDGASGEIRSYCDWSITQEVGITKTLDGNGYRTLWLKTMYLTAVASVTVDGVAQVYDRDYGWTEDGKLIRNVRWPRSSRSIVVTYTHGYPTVPETVKNICLAAAARSYSNPEAARTISEGAVSHTYAGAAIDVGPGLTSSEYAKLGPWRIIPI